MPHFATLKEAVFEVMKHNVGVPMSIDDVLDVVMAKRTYDFSHCRKPKASLSHALSTCGTYIRVRQGIYVYGGKGSSVQALKKVNSAIRLSNLHHTDESETSVEVKSEPMLHERKHLREFYKKRPNESQPVAPCEKKQKTHAPPRILPKPQTVPQFKMGPVACQYPMVFYSHQQVMAYACLNAQQYLLSCNQSC